MSLWLRKSSPIEGATRPHNKELKLTKPSIMELRSLTLCSADCARAMRAYGPITLSRTQALYVSLVLLVVIPAVVVVAFQPSLENVWCQRFELPKYEKALGFTFGPIAITGDSGDRESLGIAWVDPSGAFSRSGMRAGDFPRMQHGIRDFCAALSWVTQGQAVPLEVINVVDVAKGSAGRRIVTVEQARP
jgi:hypothetical protein